MLKTVGPSMPKPKQGLCMGSRRKEKITQIEPKPKPKYNARRQWQAEGGIKPKKLSCHVVAIFHRNVSFELKICQVTLWHKTFKNIQLQYATTWHIELIKKYHVTLWYGTFLSMLILCSIKSRLILLCNIKPRNLATLW